MANMRLSRMLGAIPTSYIPIKCFLLYVYFSHRNGILILAPAIVRSKADTFPRFDSDRSMPYAILCFLFINGFVSSAPPVDLRIPLSADSLGYHVANVSVPDLGLLNLNARIGVGGRILMVNSNYSLDHLSYHAIGINGLQNYHYFPRIRVSINVGPSYLSIGPTSDLTRSVGSVAVIQARERRQAELLLGSTQAYFISTCIDNSIMRFPLPIDFNLALHFNTGGLLFGYAGGVESGRDTRLLRQVPRSVMESILGSLSEMGISRDYGSGLYSNVFSNCTSSIVQDLPDFTVTIRHQSTEYGSIIFSPENYINFQSDGNCRIMVHEAAEEIQVSFNPLALFQTNSRISSDNHIELCDSAI